MAYKRIRRETKIRIFTLLLVIFVLGKVVLGYYQKTVDHRDRLTAKRIEQSIALVLAKNVGVGLTYDNGRIKWSEENSTIIKNGITEALTEDVFPTPKEKGYYYYMYLESPYTVIKLPYKIKGSPDIDLEVVTEDYIKKNYPKDEYVQVDEKVPMLFQGYVYKVDDETKIGMVVCLNS